MLVRTEDGRDLDLLDTGGEGFPVVYHSGTPGGLVPFAPTVEAAQAVGLRWISYSRPGYGASSPRPGRTVADAAADTATVLDALGLGEFVTYGWSGGGPHALACALLGDRCRAVALVASAAPRDAEGLDFLAGMGEDNIEEFGLALQGREALTPFLAAAAAELATVTADEIVASFGNLLPPVDAAALTGELAEWLAASCRHATLHGPGGWVDDDLAFTVPWGFSLADLTVPVSVWQGGQDLMVPLGHGHWLAANLPGARAHFLSDHGHVSLSEGVIPRVLADLAAFRPAG